MKVLEVVAKLGHKRRADKLLKKSIEFGFNKKEDPMNDCVMLEMRMAEIMSEQEANYFRFDVEAAERVRAELQERS